MSIRRRLALGLSCAILALPAHAQTTRGIAIGPSFPSGDLAAIDGPGYHLMAFAQAIPLDKVAGLRFEAAYHAFPRSEIIQHVTERVFYGSVNMVARPIGAGKTSAYLVGGFGMYNQGLSPQQRDASSSNELGFNAGPGVRFTIAGHAAFGEVRYHQILTDVGARFLPITFGLVF